MKFHRVLIILVATMLFASAAHAAWVDPNLEQQLGTADADENVKAVVFLEQVNLPALLRDLDRRNASLARRHYEVLTALQEKAAETQGRVLAVLDSAKANSRLMNYRTFWIANAVAITAKPDVIGTLRNHPDVSKIFYEYPIETIEPVGEPKPDLTAGIGAGIEPGIAATRAPELWAMGFNGSNAIVGDCDTGADGTHPALAARWRGLEADPAQCWFDPVTNTTFPFDSAQHGTHTLGTITGDDGTGNQIGMAPGAKWIAAGVIDRVSIPETLSDAILAFQWFADPDGNPATMEDVPDVISNSWGVGTMHGYPPCDETMWAAIDGAEAAGVPVVFAAGNEGPGAQTIRSPGNRIASDVNTFAVGALNQDATTAADFSSRGPSDCDGVTIKPEVAAVGVDVRSSVPGGQYITMSGTSMATPHVAGAIVLLRDAFPEATPEDVKLSLYMTAVDLGDPGEDNVFGRGRIDVVEAYYYLQSIMANPDGKVYIGSKYGCDSTINIRVTDIDLTGPTQDVTIESTTETTPETVTLTQGTAPGIYAGSIQTAPAPAVNGNGVLEVSDLDTITVTYIDADDGNGNTDVPKTDTAAVDCAAPVFAGLATLTPGDAQVALTWDPATDASSVSYNVYRGTDAGGEDFGTPVKHVNASPLNDTTVTNGQEYFYVVRAVDAFGQEDTNNVEMSGTPVGPDYLFREDFEDGLADWTVVDGGAPGKTWTGDNPGSRMPFYATGLFAVCDKQNQGPVAAWDEQLISPAIDCSGHNQITLSFANEFSSTMLDYGDVDYSFDLENWSRIVRYRFNNDSEIATFDMPQLNFHPVVYLRFHYVANTFMGDFWAVDTVTVRGWPAEGTTSTSTTTTTVVTTTSTTTTIPADDDTADDDTAGDDSAADDTVDDDLVDDTADDSATDDSVTDDTADDDSVSAAGSGNSSSSSSGCCG